MDPMIQAVVSTLVSGAIALAPAAAEQAGKSAVGEVVKDAYSRFKGYIIGKYTKVTGDISQLEEDPEDTDRQNMIGKVLEKAGAEKDEQLAELAKELFKALQDNSPAAAKRINADITQLKVGGDPDGDVVKVKLARSIMGDHALIRVDANCAWDLSQAERTLERMRPYGIASVEQPLKPGDSDLPFLKRQIPEVIVADESLTTFADAKKLIETKSCGAFNIRISKVGGIFAAMRLVEMAQNASLECHLGAQVGESGILASAQRHFALAWPHFANIEGAMNLFLLKRDLTSECETVPLGACASVRARDGRGLGVTLKRSLMQSLTVGGAL